MRNAKSIFSRGISLLFVAVLLLSGITVLATTERGQKLLGFSPAVKISLSANVERDKKLQPVSAKTVVNPGEVINWNLNSVNEGNAAAQGFKAVGEIPAGTSFIAGTANGEASAKVSYSIDGGKNYSEQPMIDETQPDGSVKKVPAPVSAYTHVLFQWDAPLEAGDKFNAHYRVRVN